MSDSSNEVPLVSLELERSILAAAIEQPELLRDQPLRVEHFGQAAHQHIARAIETVSLDQPVNATNIVLTLKQTARLNEIGGTEYLARLLQSSPACSSDDFSSWNAQLRQLWEKRVALTEARALVAKLQTNSVDDHFGAFRDAYEYVDRIRQPDETPLGIWATELGDPNVEPERETWLLQDSLVNKPALPLGRAAMMSAAGGTGKTTVLVQLAVSVALGLPWCGFDVITPGPVVLCCGESDEKLVKRQLWRSYNLLELDGPTRTRAASQILVLPLSGREVNMIRGQGSQLERTEFLVRFRARLIKLADTENFGWSLIVLDPLSRFAGPDTEKDNAAATRFAQAVETLTQLPGTPTVICSHHSSKMSMRDGQNDSRGVSGLRDAFRAVMTLTRCTVETLVGVWMQCDKSNEAPHFVARWLVQGSGVVGGTLRLATDPEAEMLEEAANKPNRGSRVVPTTEPLKPPVREVIIQKLTELGGSAKSRGWLRGQIEGYRISVIDEEFKAMQSDGLITIDTDGRSNRTVRLVNSSEPSQVAFSCSGFTEQHGGTNETA